MSQPYFYRHADAFCPSALADCQSAQNLQPKMFVTGREKQQLLLVVAWACGKGSTSTVAYFLMQDIVVCLLAKESQIL